VVGRVGDGVEAVADLGDRPIGGLEHAGYGADGGLARFQVFQTLVDGAADGDRLGADRGCNGVDFAGGPGRFLGQLAHFVGDHRKSAALFSGPRSLDGGIQGKQIGLFGNVLDLAGHVGDRLGIANELADRFGHFTDGLFDYIHLAHQGGEIAAAFLSPGEALLGLPLNVAGIAGDGRDAIDELLDDGGRGTGLLILLAGTLRDAVGAVGEEGNLGGNLGGGVAHLADQTAEILHHFVEYHRSLAHLVLAADRQAPGEVALAAGDVLQALAQIVQRNGDEMAGQQEDDDQ
jgi:hypothetical protein